MNKQTLLGLIFVMSGVFCFEKSSAEMFFPCADVSDKAAQALLEINDPEAAKTAKWGSVVDDYNEDPLETVSRRYSTEGLTGYYEVVAVKNSRDCSVISVLWKGVN